MVKSALDSVRRLNIVRRGQTSSGRGAAILPHHVERWPNVRYHVIAQSGAAQQQRPDQTTHRWARSLLSLHRVPPYCIMILAESHESSVVLIALLVLSSKRGIMYLTIHRRGERTYHCLYKCVRVNGYRRARFVAYLGPAACSNIGAALAYWGRRWQHERNVIADANRELSDHPTARRRRVAERTMLEAKTRLERIGRRMDRLQRLANPYGV